MGHSPLDVERIEETSETYLQRIGGIFAVFDERTQDSGNISYGVQLGSERYFIKTAGRAADPRPFLRHPERVSLLRNAIRLARSSGHPALPRLRHVIEAPDGPLLIYQWVEGELIGADRATRDDPRSAFQRLRALPVPEIVDALDVIYGLHRELAQAGWIAVDFYDGSLIYDFAGRQLHVVDLDLYRDAPFTNEMGRMFGSSRFMASEEFERGALIDEATNVYTMGRTAAVLLSDGTLERLAFRGSGALYQVVCCACQADRARRFATIAEFYATWQAARRVE